MPNEQLDATALAKLQELLKTIDLTDVTADSTGSNFELEDGYYLCTVNKAVLTTSKSGNVQVAMTLTVVDKGYEEDKETAKVIEMKKSFKNRKIYKYFPLTDDKSIKRFATDMLKFEDEPGHPILPKQQFLTIEGIEEALPIIETMNVYVNVSNVRDDDGKITNTWYNLISWKRASALELPVD